MAKMERKLLSGNEAIALAALHSGCSLGVGYPGTPSTEILEEFSRMGGSAQWAPNEKVAAEVALGVAFGSGNALCTMKHVGFNVSQDLFFTAAYSGVNGGFVAVVADDPGMASSQNEQDTRSLAMAGGLPLLEPSDSQEAYDFTRLAFKLSRKFGSVFIIRTTTRIAHSSTAVCFDSSSAEPKPDGDFERNIPARVMVPAHARPAHVRLRARLAEIEKNADKLFNFEFDSNDKSLGIIADGVAYMHAREVAPNAGFFKVGMANPLPVERIVEFSKKYKRCICIEEGDPYLNTLLLAAGANVEKRDEKWRFGEFNSDRAKAQIDGNLSYEPKVFKSKPPQLCKGCPHIFSFTAIKELGCIVAGDIGCYTLAAAKPLEAMDIQICMGASIGVGLGLRRVLPEEKARKVVSVIGDSTFMHSGLTGLVEAVYNKPSTGHVIIVVDNSTTAMTGQQDNPSSGAHLDSTPAKAVSIEEVAKAVGADNVAVFVPARQSAEFKEYLAARLAEDGVSLIILKQPCLLAAAKKLKAKKA